MRLAATTMIGAMAILLAGCAGDDDGAAAADRPSGGSTTSAATPTDANGFPLPERPACAAETAGDFVVATTSDGNGVGILLLGDGDAGVVLSPQDGGDICMMLAYGEELAATYRVALHDWKEPRPEVPLLAISSRQDGYFGSADARRLQALHRGPETVLMLPGSLHGVEMLDGPDGTTVRAAVDRFLARVLG